MKILCMTATFGKLENQTLMLTPGLNVISAPNEWGKSTWCAFIATMLYGLDTREKSTKTAMAVKERYAPWSGAPMAGRMDLEWNGRQITIERRSKGRTPMGEFRAYETESGVPVPEITGTNCGETLLGVEKSVFLRAGFLRLADLPVTADESLRRRLNALVTTGDDSGAGDALGQKLRDLKNKCRFNRTGLIPQAEAERQVLEEKLGRLQILQDQSGQFARQQEELQEQIASLENHLLALEYAAGEENQNRIDQARQHLEEAKAHWERLREQCSGLPDAGEIARMTGQLQQLHQESIALGFEQQALPQTPQTPAGTDEAHLQDACAQARRHSAWLQQLQQDRQKAGTMGKYGWISLAAAIPIALIFYLAAMPLWLVIGGGAAPLAVGVILLCIAGGIQKEAARHLRELEMHYGSLDGEAWVRKAEADLAALREYRRQQASCDAVWEAFRAKQRLLTEKIAALTQGRPIADCLRQWEAAAREWEALEKARRDLEAARAHADTVCAMAKPVQKPPRPDTLTYSPEETRRLLEEKCRQAQLLQQRLGECQGAMAQLGNENALRSQLEAVNERLDRLEQTYRALELAMQTLENATAELQRRFAPKIAAESKDLFGSVTGGRYDRLMLRPDLTVDIAADGETATRSGQWRSDGTVDQMYFALRLAVARALTPQAPMVLDDVLVRFDDVRHGAAMEVLRREAENRQIILFSCQTRECQ